ncbi:hypothetical protein ACGFZR_15080 [Streptomyces sp. NPDC048241]|uniref:hypothetical protein n=1 Tax=Streptomyces sp. NPDC048241 TaxID=3365521 RepID=UPI0037127EBC
MAQYLVTYTDGSEQHIPAESVHCDTDNGQYVFYDGDRNIVAFALYIGVVSVVRVPETTGKAVSG